MTRAARRACASGRCACCAATGGRVSTGAAACATRSPARRRRATATSGTGTRASTRSSGATSTRRRARSELRTLLKVGQWQGLPPPHDVLGLAGGLAPRAALCHRVVQEQPGHHLDTDAADRARLGGGRRRVRRPARVPRPRRSTSCGATTTGWPTAATPTATGCSRSCCPTSRGSTTRPSTTASTAGWRTTGRATSRSSSRRAGCAATRTRSPARTDRHVEDVLVNVFYALSLRALARLCGEATAARSTPSAPRASSAPCSSAATTSAPGLFLDLAGRGEAPRPRVDLVGARAARARRAAGRRAPAAGRGAPARPSAATSAPVGIPSVAREERGVQPALRPLALLARAGVDGDRLAARAADAATGLRRRGRPDRRARSPGRSSASATASTTTRSTAPAWPRASSGCRRCWSTCCRPTPDDARSDAAAGLVARRALAVATAATASTLLDVTVVYLALPDLGSDLGPTFTQQQWVDRRLRGRDGGDAARVRRAAPTAAAGGACSSPGWLSSARRRSACAAAPDGDTLAVARAVQGLGAARSSRPRSR